MNIALVHDHLIQLGGAERVLKIFHELFPRAPIFTLLYDRKKLKGFFDHATIITSFLQKVPYSTHAYQWLLPLMPHATERYDLSSYDIVLSSCSAFAKGTVTKSTTLHICYCHTPTRYLWSDTHAYLREMQRARFIKPFIPFFLTSIRSWDQLSAGRVDRFIANSKTVQERIKKYYKRESDVIYPPVEIEKFSLPVGAGEYFLGGGRLVAYKRIDLLVQAFNKLGTQLKIFGEGPELPRLKKYAKKNIEFLGNVSDEDRAHLYQHCIAYIHPQEEDFGITAIEAMASGRPVIALAAGGALETVVDGVTGEFFYDQDYAAIITTILQFKPERFDPRTIRTYAERFGVKRFRHEIEQTITHSWNEWQELQQMKRLRETKRMF